jgi:hypothetical protein
MPDIAIFTICGLRNLYIYMHTIFMYIYSIEYSDFELTFFVVCLIMATLAHQTELELQPSAINC